VPAGFAGGGGAGAGAGVTAGAVVVTDVLLRAALDVLIISMAKHGIMHTHDSTPTMYNARSIEPPRLIASNGMRYYSEFMPCDSRLLLSAATKCRMPILMHSYSRLVLTKRQKSAERVQVAMGTGLREDSHSISSCALSQIVLAQITS
jgi:hypothetical protein